MDDRALGFNEGRRLAVRSVDVDADAELRRRSMPCLRASTAPHWRTCARNWKLVETLVERLMIDQELSGDEVRALLMEASGARAS